MSCSGCLSRYAEPYSYQLGGYVPSGTPLQGEYKAPNYSSLSGLGFSITDLTSTTLQTIIPGVPNLYVTLGGSAAALLLITTMGGGRRRK